MVSLDKYPCFCKDSSGLKSFEAKSDGVQYTRCANGKCGIFTRSENVPAYMEVFHDGVLPYYKKNRIPTCKHDEPATFRISQSQTNKNRGFFSCSRKRKDGCNFFQWSDSPPSKTNKTLWFTYDEKFAMQMAADQPAASYKQVTMVDKACSPIKKRPLTLNGYTIPKKKVKSSSTVTKE